MTLAASPGLETSLYDDDRRLVARCRAGERDACEELYRRHAPRVLGLARRMVGPAEDAEDAVQDVFLAGSKSSSRSGASRRWPRGSTGWR